MMSQDKRRTLRDQSAAELHWVNDEARAGHAPDRSEFLAEFPNGAGRLEELLGQGLVLTDVAGRFTVSEWVQRWLTANDRRA
jgi:hypothetical protein